MWLNPSAENDALLLAAHFCSSYRRHFSSADDKPIQFREDGLPISARRVAGKALMVRSWDNCWSVAPPYLLFSGSLRCRAYLYGALAMAAYNIMYCVICADIHLAELDDP